MRTELLRFLIFSISAWTLSFSNFLNLFLTYLCIKISLRTNNPNSNYFDPVIMMSNLLNLFIHLLSFQLTYIVSQINKTKFGSTFFSIYNLANEKLVQVQNYIFDKFLLGPIKFIISEFMGFGFIKTDLNFPQDKSNVILPKKLSNETEINDFLDGLIDKKID